MNTYDLLICAFLLAVLYVYRIYKKSYSFFDQNGIPYIKPTFVFGNAKDWILMKKPLPVVHHELYKQLEPYKFVGVFTAMKASVMVRDPELIRNMLTKDFAHFYDRGLKRDPHVDKLSKNLFAMTGQEWKNLRIKLTGTFTTGKMKMMFPLVSECGTKLNNLMNGLSDERDLDIKDLCARYTTDVIGSCAFGLEINSLDNPDSEFRQMGKRMLEVNFRVILRSLFPNLVSIFKSFLINTRVQNFFINLVQETVKYREENKITRGDFLDLLIALKNETDSQKLNDNHAEADLDKFFNQIGEKKTKSNIEVTPEIVVAQCFLFFLAGFETSASTLSFMLLELAQNQHIQDKLREEIHNVLENNDNQLTYEVLKQMKYLDMVMAETLRKYPITGNLVRVCTQAYKIPDTKVVLQEGTPIIISICGLHNDEKYYEKPTEFYPEHFTEEAKSKRPHYTYLPFGEGPRVCIGERFAKMQTKVAAINLLKNYSYRISSRTKLPAEFAPGFGIMEIKGGKEWKNLRTELTTLFTLERMKVMFLLMNEYGEKLSHLVNQMTGEESFDVNDVVGRYATDTIAACLFGIEANTLDNPNSEFRRVGKDVGKFRYRYVIKTLWPNIVPDFMKKFPLWGFGVKSVNSSEKMFVQTVMDRENNNITRNDLLDVLIALKNNTIIEQFENKGQTRELEKFLARIGDKRIKSNTYMTNEILTTQCYGFHLASNNTSKYLSYVLLELARNQLIQHKLRHEIKSVLGKNRGQLTYDALNEMTYMDIVIDETQRIYSSALISREATKDYEIPGTKIVIPAGTAIVIPVAGIHNDPKYYDNPNEFRPERFMKSEKSQRPSCTFIPFGGGPRGCLGKRFGKMQIKIGLVYMLKDSSYLPSPRMKFPITFVNDFKILKVDGGIWLQRERL